MSGKNKKSTITYNNIKIDSVEEWHMFCWLDEAKTLGIVKNYIYQPDSFVLTPVQTYVPYFNNQKQKVKHLLRDHVYTADFKIDFNIEYGQALSQAFKIDNSMIDNDTVSIFVDVKGSFNLHGGDRLFSIHQKLVYDKYKILVQKIVPKEMFKKLGIAKANLKTPTGRASKIHSSYNFIKTVFFTTK